uniref:Pyridoxal-dependent decarboxylase domain-containing protein 1 n=1 Tax=Steinernema glaseri TaxID=37863 RepID=A0A1I7ZU56_9BILA
MPFAVHSSKLAIYRKSSPENKKGVTSVSISNESGISSIDSGMSEEKDCSVTETSSSARKSSTSDRACLNPILHQLEQLIVSDEWIGKDHSPVANAPRKLSAARSLSSSSSTTSCPRLNELGRTLVTSASLKSYIDLLGQHHRQSIAAWLSGNVSTSLSQLCRFPAAQLFCHPSEQSLFASYRPGIGHCLRLALRERYGSEYALKGWRAFAEQGAPVIYVTPALHVDILAYVATEFAICDVVVLDAQDDPLADYEKFAVRLNEDIKQGKKPLLLIGVVGSAILGHNDMISKLLEIRNSTAPFWIHVVGNAVAALALQKPNETLVQVLSQVDSIMFPLARWLGIPAAPIFTLHRPVDTYKPSYHEKLDSLPWWVTTQYLTPKHITEMLEQAYFLSKIMLKGLSKFKQIRIIGFDNPVEYADRVYKGIYTAPTVITFKCFYNILPENNNVDTTSGNQEQEIDSTGDAVECAEEALESSEKEMKLKLNVESNDALDEYVDSLNSWLGQGLLTECRQLGLQLIDLGTSLGLAFRFCPLESASTCNTRPAHVQQFINHLEQSMKIIDSTVAAKNEFAKNVAEFPELCSVNVNKWAGVGAVCYIPSILKGSDQHTWNEKQKQQISHLNLEIVHSLRSTDSAFSTGECQELDVSCIKFGMLSDEKDLRDLVSLVAERGKTIEESQQYMDSLAELIRQGIQAANEDLKRESNMRLQQEGVMRQLPMVGSLFNWFSPLDKEVQNIRGRSFDLNTGMIQSTETIYKHMQGDSIQETPLQTPHGNVNEKTEEEKPTLADDLVQEKA